MISVLVLTKNEERDLPGCLASVSWCDDVHVLDSESTDNTRAIAESYGATVLVRAFDNWAAHQNWAMKNVPFKHEWVFYIDADERMTPELASFAQKAVLGAHDEVAFRVQRRDFLLGTWLKHVQVSSYYLRLFRPEKMRYERLVNPISIPDGPTGDVAGYLDHFPFSKGVGQWIERHNSYSRLEAEQITGTAAADRRSLSIWKAFFERDFHLRRQHQKELFYRAPFRPFLKFVLLYLVKRGFLDGKAGFVYACLQSIYEYFIVLKVQEIEAVRARSATPGDFTARGRTS